MAKLLGLEDPFGRMQRIEPTIQRPSILPNSNESRMLSSRNLKEDYYEIWIVIEDWAADAFLFSIHRPLEELGSSWIHRSLQSAVQRLPRSGGSPRSAALATRSACSIFASSSSFRFFFC